MSEGFSIRAVAGVVAAAAASLALAASAGAASGPAAVIEGQDACDPATFPLDPAGNPACVRQGDSGRRVTIGEFMDRLGKDREVGGWRFAPDKVRIRQGQSVLVRMGRGGELHTFTEVPALQPGCVDIINQVMFGSPEVNPLCADPGALFASAITPATQFPPNRTVELSGLSRGRHFYECLIHPWMVATVTVE
jgi:plastocyanin